MLCETSLNLKKCLIFCAVSFHQKIMMYTLCRFQFSSYICFIMLCALYCIYPTISLKHWLLAILQILICAYYKERKIGLKCDLSKYNKRVIIRYTFINCKSAHKNHDSSDDDDGHRCNQQRAKCNSWQIKNGLCFSKGTFPIAKQFIQRIAGWQNLIFKLALDDRFMFIC